MPRKSRKKQPESPAGEIVTLDEPKLNPKLVAEFTAAMQDDPKPLAEIVEQYGLKPASELPRQLPPAEPTLEPFPLSEQGPHTAAVIASRGGFRPIPEGYLNVDSYPTAGIKVNRTRDKSVVAVQFSDDKLPSREEKDALQAKRINYDPPTKQWTRRDDQNHAANIIDAKGVAEAFADARKGLSR